MTRQLSKAEIESFQADGVVLANNAISNDWVEKLLQVADQQLQQPGDWSNDGAPGKQRDRMFTDRYLWQKNAVIHDYIHQSPCAELAAQAMRSTSARFYFDHLLVKEPNTNAVTPWHQDIPYWPFLGKQVCSIWVALTPATIEGSAMEFVRGSHLDGNYYLPEVFGNREDHPNAAWTGKSQGVPVPEIDADRKQFDIVGWDVEPGDAVIFSSWILHGAGGNHSPTQRRAAMSTRWLGDDAVWHPHAGADPTVNPADVAVQPGATPSDEKFFPLIWPQK